MKVELFIRFFLVVKNLATNVINSSFRSYLPGVKCFIIFFADLKMSIELQILYFRFSFFEYFLPFSSRLIVARGLVPFAGSFSSCKLSMTDLISGLISSFL